MKRVKSEIKTSKTSQIQSDFLYLILHYDKPALESPPTNTSQYLYLNVFRSLCERCICNFFFLCIYYPSDTHGNVSCRVSKKEKLSIQQ